MKNQFRFFPIFEKMMQLARGLPAAATRNMDGRSKVAALNGIDKVAMQNGISKVNIVRSRQRTEYS